MTTGRPMGRPVGPPRTPFERRLRELMEAASITSYTDLAEKSNVGRTTVDRACRGYPLSPLAAAALAAALGITVDELMAAE